MKMSKVWKVIYVASGAEKKVADRLNEMGVVAYAPLITEVRQWSDSKEKRACAAY